MAFGDRALVEAKSRLIVTWSASEKKDELTQGGFGDVWGSRSLLSPG